MTKKEKAALLAAGEKRLAFFERLVDETLQRKDFSSAWAFQHAYDGAARMLEALGLLSYSEAETRSRGLYDHCMAANFPEHFPQEAN